MSDQGKNQQSIKRASIRPSPTVSAVQLVMFCFYFSELR